MNKLLRHKLRKKLYLYRIQTDMRNFFFLLALSFLFLTHTSILHAQTGPGGVGNSINNLYWFDAGNLGLNNSDLVPALTDYSGNGNHISQSNTSRQGSFSTNQINGYPAVELNGVNQFYQSTTFNGVSGIDELTTFIVADVQNNFSRQTLINLNNSVSDNSFLLAKVNSNLNSYGPRSGGITSSSTAFTAGTKIYSQVFDGTVDQFRTFDNSSVIATRNNATGDFTGFDEIRLGSLILNSGWVFGGQYAEVLIFNEAVNETQRKIIDNYLSAKYAIALSANDKYAFDATHNNEVAGIGQESATDNHTAAQGTSIVLIENPDDLNDGEYAMWGHDDAGYGNNNNDFDADTVQMDQEWIWDESGGDVGAVDVTFDMSGRALGTDPSKYLLIATDDGDFSNGLVMHGDGDVLGINNLSINGNLITFTGVDFDDEDYFTIAYDGLVDSCRSQFIGNWANNGNWTCGTAPDSTKNVIVTTTDVVDITADANVLDLKIEAGATLDVAANTTLTIFGDLILQSGATLSLGTGSTLEFESTFDAQTITNNGNDIDAYNLVIRNNSGVTATVGDFSVANVLTLSTGTFTLVDSLHFLSTPTLTARLEGVGASGNLVANMRVQRYADARNAGWNDLASPLVGTLVSDLDDDLFISGVTGADGYAVNNNGGGFISMWKMNNVTQDWEAVSNVTDPMTNGEGFELWLAEDLNNWNGGSWDMTGTINTNDVTQQTIDIETGWNLVGNPFPAFLSFDFIAARAGNITNSEFWTVEATTNTFVAKTAFDIIPPGQGFWVHTTNGTDLTIDPTTDFESLLGANSFLYKNEYTPDEEVRILLTNNDADKPLGSNIYLRKNNFSFGGADAHDIPALRRPMSDNSYLAFESYDQENMVNYISTYEDHVELPIKAESGMDASFTMTFDGLDEFYEYQCINLVNHETGEQIPLTSDSEYTFDLTSNEAINMSLILSKEDHEDCLAPVTYSEGLVEVSTIGKMVMADFHLDQAANAQIDIYTITGSLLHTQKSTVGYSRETMNLESVDAGVYLISVTVNGETQTEKIILQ